ncbi:MAG: class I SAM-dependent methyltransferase [Candidatus Levyibacteriota bacterium]
MHFQNPIPSPAFLQKLYEDIYKKKYNLICAESAFTDYNHLQEEKRIAAIEKFKPGGRLLDVGASTGFFLKSLLKHKKWDGEGVEYSRGAVAKRVDKKIKIYTGDIFSKKIPNHAYDVVTMHSVFEHVPNPLETLQEVRKKLKDEGLFVFNVPNMSSLEYFEYKKLRKSFPGFIFEHLFYYNPQSITLLLEKTGFRVVKMTSRHYSTLHMPPKRPLIGLFTFPQKLFLEYTELGGALKKGNILYVYAVKK